MISSENNIKLLGDMFVEEIQNLVKKGGMSYMDAVIHWCESNEIEIDIGAELVNKSTLLKTKIEEEAEGLHFLPRSNHLPI